MHSLSTFNFRIVAYRKLSNNSYTVVAKRLATTRLAVYDLRSSCYPTKQIKGAASSHRMGDTGRSYIIGLGFPVHL